MVECIKCNKLQPEEAFSKRPSGNRKRDCKACVNTYSRTFYHANQKRYAATRRRNKKRQRQELREELALLKSGPCVDCKKTYSPWQMQFDHVRGTKRFHLAEAARLMPSKERLLEELKKTELVCSNCHADRTYKRRQAVAQG